VSDKAVRFVAKGKVQGVGYRAYVERNANQLGLVGFVRNDPDGTVTGVVQGPADVVDQLIERMKAGPRAAVVQSLDVRSEPRTELTGFEVRR
jgi:acylphosphatase